MVAVGEEMIQRVVMKVVYFYIALCKSYTHDEVMPPVILSHAAPPGHGLGAYRLPPAVL